MKYWSVKSRYLSDSILHFIGIIRRNYTRSYNIQSYSYSDVGVIIGKVYNLADTDPTSTLDSCSGIQNEQRNTWKNVIDVEVRSLST